MIDTKLMINGKPFTVRRDEVCKYLDEEFFFYYSVYKRIKLLGLPNGKGWINERQDIIDSYLILYDEEKLIRGEELTNEIKTEIKSKRG